jgi:protein FAM161A
MATRGHGFSVLANASLRRPVNPKTGFASASFDLTDDVRQTTHGERDEDERDADESHLAEPPNNDPEQATDGDDFYQKLIQLKEAHKKTLLMWEKMYRESHPEGGDQPDAANITRSRLASLENLLSNDVHHATNHSFQEPESGTSSGHVRDRVQDLSMTTKPPSGKLHSSNGLPVKSSSGIKSGVASRDHMSDHRANSYHSSLSGDFTDNESNRDDDEHHREERDGRIHVDTRQSAMARIDDMWERFSIDSYCPRSSTMPKTRPGLFRSSSLSRLSTVDRDLEQRGSARTQQRKVTVPKPFSMSIRESVKTPRKSRVAIELEQHAEERKRLEELECQKKFKAMPLPAHIHLRLYDELREAQESRRRNIVENRQELLQSMQKPFQFTLRDEDKKKKCRPSSAAVERTTSNKKPKTVFRAHPFPSHIFEDTAAEKILEEEEYRKIRMRMRAKELLRSSSLPPTMKMKGKEYTEGHERRRIFEERAKRAGFTVEHRFRPRINSTIPDFDKQYDRFMRELSQRKQMHESTTVCRPFNLRTSAPTFGTKHRGAKTKPSKSYMGTSDDEESLQENERPSLKASMSMSFTGSYSQSFDAIPSKTTQSTVLRASANRLKLQQRLEKEEAERRKVADQQIRKRQLKKSIVEKSVSMDSSTVEKEIKEKLIMHKRANQEKAQNYKQQLDEMNRRVQTRPLLFEQLAQRNARQAAERHYLETLSKSGIDVNLLSKNSTASSSAADETFRVEGGDAADDAYSATYGSGRASPNQHHWSPVAGHASPGLGVGLQASRSGSSSRRESMGHKSRSASGAGTPSGANYSAEFDDDDEQQQQSGASTVSEEDEEEQERELA